MKEKRKREREERRRRKRENGEALRLPPLPLTAPPLGTSPSFHSIPGKFFHASQYIIDKTTFHSVYNIAKKR